MSFESDAGLPACCIGLKSDLSQKWASQSFICVQGGAGLRRMSTFVLGQEKSTREKVYSATGLSEADLSVLMQENASDTPAGSSESLNHFNNRPEVSSMTPDLFELVLSVVRSRVCDSGQAGAPQGIICVT